MLMFSLAHFSTKYQLLFSAPDGQHNCPGYMGGPGMTSTCKMMPLWQAPGAWLVYQYEPGWHGGDNA